jgi:PadR family transcriptional regulator AphA
MKHIVHRKSGIVYLEISDRAFVLESEQDALDLAALCGEYASNLLLLNTWNLDDRFYDLKTGLAGSVLQKFSSYRINMAAVVPPEAIKGRFGEMVMEANKGKQFRICTEKADAERWLTGGNIDHK